MKKYSLLLFAILICNTPVLAQTTTFIFNHDTTFNNNFEIPDNTTCTIKPGVTIRFNGYFSFIVRGTIIARGTTNAPILFTCSDRTRGSQDAACWDGIVNIGSKAKSSFLHCRFEGMYRNLVWESSPLFDSCEFVGCHYALYCTKNASPLVRGCKFYRNVYGIVADYATPILRSNTITENVIGIYLQAGSMPLAGPNIIIGNKTNIRSETALKGDTSAMSIRYLWDIMNELY